MKIIAQKYNYIVITIYIYISDYRRSKILGKCNYCKSKLLQYIIDFEMY